MTGSGVTIVSSPIRVLVVDDHPTMRDGLRATFEAQPEAFTVVGIAGGPVEAASTFTVTRPDVVVMDFAMPGKDGITLATEFKAQRPSTRVLLLTGQDNPAVAERAITEGCDGFLLKTETPATIVDAVRRVHSGEVLFDAYQLGQAVQQLRRREPAGLLSKRELEVLRLLARGTSTETMATDLFVSANTIRSHVRRILEKLNAHSKLEAVAFAVRDGILRSADFQD
jgi:DNA-binding NarL/FixJ family response regulator